MVNVAGAQFQTRLFLQFSPNLSSGALKSDAGGWTIGEVEGWNFGAVAKFISPQNILKLLNSQGTETLKLRTDVDDSDEVNF